MKINEILTEDIEQLDEINWKKAAAAATLAGAGLFGGAQSADAQIFDPSLMSALSAVSAEAANKNFISDATESDILKMANFIGQIEPFYESGEMTAVGERKFKQMLKLYNTVYDEKLSLPKQLLAKIERKKGSSSTKSKVGKVFDVPGYRELKDLISSVSSKKKKEEYQSATAGMTPEEKRKYNFDSMNQSFKTLNNTLDQMIASGNSPEAQKRLEAANERMAAMNKQMEEYLRKSSPNLYKNNTVKDTETSPAQEKIIQVKDKELSNGNKFTGSWTYYGPNDKEGEPTWDQVGEITEKDGTKSIGTMGKYGINPGWGKIITKNGETVSGIWEPDEKSESETALILMPTTKADVQKILYLFPEHPLKSQLPKVGSDQAARDKALRDAFRADMIKQNSIQNSPPKLNYKPIKIGSDTWTGPVNVGKAPHGQGTLTYSNGASIHGEFVNGQPSPGPAFYRGNELSDWIKGELYKDKDGKIKFGRK